MKTHLFTVYVLTNCRKVPYNSLSINCMHVQHCRYRWCQTSTLSNKLNRKFHKDLQRNISSENGYCLNCSVIAEYVSMRRPARKQISMDCSTEWNKCMVTPVLSRRHIVQIKENFCNKQVESALVLITKWRSNKTIFASEWDILAKHKHFSSFRLRQKIINQMLF